LIATPVLADLKEREPEFKQLRKQIAQRASTRSGRRRSPSAVLLGRAPASDEAPEATAVAEVTTDEVDPTSRQ